MSTKRGPHTFHNTHRGILTSVQGILTCCVRERDRCARSQGGTSRAQGASVPRSNSARTEATHTAGHAKAGHMGCEHGSRSRPPAGRPCTATNACPKVPSSRRVQRRHLLRHGASASAASHLQALPASCAHACCSCAMPPPANTSQTRRASARRSRHTPSVRTAQRKNAPPPRPHSVVDRCLACGRRALRCMMGRVCP